MAQEGVILIWHDEVMDDPVKVVLSSLAPTMTEKGFYLGGGTAVAIHLGHRRSQDLDWFSPTRSADMMVLVGDLRATGVDLVVTSVEKGTLHGSIDGVPVSFLDYPYTLLEAPVSHPTMAFRLATLLDLACMKLSAVAQRGSRKDFLDIYAMGRTDIDLGTMVSLYRRKYEIEDISHLMYGLSYFDDADREAMPTMVWDVEWDEVKGDIRNWVVELVG